MNPVTSITGGTMTTTEPILDADPILDARQTLQLTRDSVAALTAVVPAAAVVRMPMRKRLFDIAIAAPVALLTLPIPFALATWSAIRFRTYPLFTQPRLGHGGTIFKFWKIRSLPAIAPDTADKYQLEALDLPRFARVMRFRHLDELPQLFLVLSGKMSLVGPRPEMPTLANSFDPAFVAERLTVRPGCTGLWQVSTSARKLIGETPEFDLHYVRHWTLRLDAWLLYRTVLAIGFRNEIESPDDIPRWTGASTR